MRWLVLIVAAGGLATPASADAFMKLFMERQAMIEVFDLKYADDCVGYDKDDLRASLTACNRALSETAKVINAGNKQVESQLMGVLAMEYLARSKVLDLLGRTANARADCAKAVRYAKLVGEREKLSFFQGQCRK